VLGAAVLNGGGDIVERFHSAEPPGCFLMEASERLPTSFFTLILEPRDRFRSRFGERASGVLRRIVRVVHQEKPAHVYFTIEFDQRS